MSQDDFVDLNETTELPLENGKSITVRRRLSWGQSLDLLAASHIDAAPADDDGEPKLVFDVVRYPLVEMRAWLVGWSFTENGKPDGEPVPVNEQTIRALREERAKEITAAIRKHVAEMRAADPKAGTAAGSTSP